jgi:phospholipid transport system substrate-binding protein
MDAKQKINRSPEILRGEMEQIYGDEGSATLLGREDVCSRRSRRSRRFPLLLFPGLLTSGASAWSAFVAINLSFVICHLSFAAAPADPVSQLRSEVDQVLAIAYSGQSNETAADRARPLLEKAFSFELVTRQAIGPGWRQFTPAEQQKVTDLFTRLVIRIYAARVVGTQRPNITYGKTATLAPDRCEIPTRISAPNGDRPYSVVYRLSNVSGAWRIYDVLIEGVSFVANYRAQFDELVRRGGAATVIKTLEAKLAEPINPNS